MMLSGILFRTVSIVGAVGFAAGCRSVPTPQAGHPSFEETEAAITDEALFRAKCASCHDIARVEEAHASMTREELRRVIERMQAMPGSAIEPDQIGPLLEEIADPDPRGPGL